MQLFGEKVPFGGVSEQLSAVVTGINSKRRFLAI